MTITREQIAHHVEAYLKAAEWTAEDEEVFEESLVDHLYGNLEPVKDVVDNTDNTDRLQRAVKFFTGQDSSDDSGHCKYCGVNDMDGTGHDSSCPVIIMTEIGKTLS